MRASTGGSDLIGFITKSFKQNIRMGNIIVIMDTIVITLNVLFFKQIEIGLYSAIAIYIMGKMIDIIFEGVYVTKLLIIISNKNEEISTQIGNQINRGSTGLIGKGMYTKEKKVVLLCAASRGDISKIKEIVKQIDENSFLIVVNSREVLGLGFKEEQKIYRERSRYK